MDGSPANGPVLGDHFGGQGLLLDQGRATFICNPLGGVDHLSELQSPAALEAGAHQLVVSISAKGFQGAIIDLPVDGRSVAQAAVDRFIRVRGDGHVGRAGVSPLLAGSTIAPVCGCVISAATIEPTAMTR